MVMSRTRPSRDSDFFGLNKRSQIEAGSAGRPSSDVKEDDVMDGKAASTSTILPYAVKEAM